MYPSQQGGCDQSHPGPFGVADLHLLHWLAASSFLFIAHWEERLPFLCLEARKSTLKAIYCAALPPVSMRACKCLMNVSLDVSGHAGLPAGYVYWEDDINSSYKMWLLCHAHFEKHWVYYPFKFSFDLKIMVTFFFWSVFTPLVIYLALFGIFLNLKKKLLLNH